MSDIGRALLNLLVERPGEWDYPAEDVLRHLPTGIYLTPYYLTGSQKHLVYVQRGTSLTDALTDADHAALYPVASARVATYKATRPTDSVSVLRALLKLD